MIRTAIDQIEYAMRFDGVSNLRIGKALANLREAEQQRDKLLAAIKALMDDNTGGTWGLPASHKDTVAARAIIAEIENSK